MTIANLIAFIKAFPIIVSRIDDLLDAVNKLITYQLERPANESNDAVRDAVEGSRDAKTKEELREAARNLSRIR